MHAAMGCNMFRQIVGKKKWWLVPMRQAPYVFPSLNPNGFSAHTRTFIGKGDEPPSPWLNKLERWEVILNPGDVMLNPPWIWHAILNIEGGEGGLSVGVPTRYAVKGMGPSFRNNWLFSLIGNTTDFAFSMSLAIHANCFLQVLPQFLTIMALRSFYLQPMPHR